MANESPLLHLGWCVSGFDARNSSLTGTTLAGPNGSGQFLAVQLSTSADLTIALATAVGAKCIGILQNKPSTGIAADVGFFGMSKMVSGSTAIAAGQELTANSDGSVIPYTSTNAGAGVAKIGRSLQAATAVGQIFSGYVYGACAGSITGATA